MRTNRGKASILPCKPFPKIEFSAFVSTESLYTRDSFTLAKLYYCTTYRNYPFPSLFNKNYYQ